MPLLTGQPITARELELAASAWPPEQFASMCNALAWAASGRKCPGLPSFTERVNAGDGGIDAEWTVEIPPDDHPIPTPILGPGWNVFQYKNRSVIGQDRQRIVSNLKSSLKEAIVELVEETGRHPDRYILFVNVDLKHDQTAALKEVILKGYDRRAEVHVEVAGAATLASLLNDHPHLRSAYFAPGPFKTWEVADRDRRNRRFFGADVELIGREKELERLRAWVDDPRVRVIVLSGPHDIGKTRLALEATKHRPHDVVVSLDPRSMALTDYRSLSAGHGEVLCIVEDPDSEALDRLVDEALTIPNLKLLVALPTSASAPAPSYGRDERVQALHLQPLGYDDSQKVLKATGKPLDFEIEDWIIDHAGGIPGVLLVAASAGPGLRSTLGNFAEAVGKEFEKRIDSELGPDALRCARLFSVMTHVGISGEYESELKQVCEVFGDGWSPHHALSALETLEKAGLARRGGSFAEITVLLLANHLLSGLLRGQADEMFALFGRLEESGRLRFLKRLREVKGPEVEKFWDALFDSNDGLLRSLDSALENAHLLKLVSGTVPERVLRLLKMELPEKNLEERRKIAGDQRRELMWTVEQLLFREKTSRGALRLLYLLAEAENESYGNNATGVFTECFVPLHPQMPLPLHERFQVLKDISSASRQGKFMAIRAAGNAFRETCVTLRHSTGAMPLDSRPVFTDGDLPDYTRDLVNLLFSLAEGDDQEVTETALQTLPDLIAELGVQGQPKNAIERFRQMVDWARDGKSGLDVSSLLDVIQSLHEVFSERITREEALPDEKAALQGHVTEMDRLETELQEGVFAVRLRRWAGSWTRGDFEDKVYEEELKRLAEEAVKNPALLDNRVVEWLLSPSAQRSKIFFFQLGHLDTQDACRQLIEQIGQRPEGNNAFASYWGGFARRDPKIAERRLDELAASDRITATAIIQATGWLKGSQAGVDRLKNQIRAGRITPERVEGILGIGPWMDITTNLFEKLLRTIAGDDFKHASVAIHMLVTRLYPKWHIEGSLADFAWRCLEHDPPVRTQPERWYFDKLAATLAKSDPDRGFKLLETLLQRDRANRDLWSQWDPVAPYGPHHFFWNTLYEKDKKRLTSLMLDLCRKDPLIQSHISWGMKRFLNHKTDRDLLLEFAGTDVAFARIVASFVTLDNPSIFWPIAFGLIQIYPSDEPLLQNLANGIQFPGVGTGPISQFYQGRLIQIEERLQDSETPPEARTWLREIAGRLKEEVTSRVVWEYDLDVNDLNSYIKDKNSPQRLWAIGRVLKYASWKDVRRLLTPEDIAEALPQVDLPDKKRKALERALEVWLHEK